jgi:biotin operon repressor
MVDKKIQQDFNRIFPFLDEKTTRLYVANQALSIGRGGKSIVSKSLGVSRVRINNGIKELLGQEPPVAVDSKRKKGGGRKSLDAHHPGIKEQIESIISPYTRGDPMNPLRWCSKSLRKIATAMKDKGYAISHVSIEKYLLENNYSLQSNRKTDEGSSEEDRDRQFEYINAKSKQFMSEKEPVISVDCKKKELIGNYKNTGREWEQSKAPQNVKVYDFIDETLGKAVPYGAYDIAQNKGWVSVGISSDTAQFAVNTIRTWWQQMGKQTYPHATKLLITADGGGSNSSRSRLWKRELQLLATETGLEINVCHYPPGTSKWNKIEHRLFSFITKNWRGEPLISLETIINLIANTTTEKGLEVKAIKDTNIYKKGIKVSDEELSKINLKGDEFKGKWNYVISNQT